MFCSKCGSPLMDRARFCAMCGAVLLQFPPADSPQSLEPQPDAPRTREQGRNLLWILLATVAIVVGWPLIYPTYEKHERERINVLLKKQGFDPISDNAEHAAPSAPTFDTGNIANDKLLALSQAAQALLLGHIVNAACNGKRAFYMGISSKNHRAYWSVGCVEGKSYEVEIEANSTGSTRVLDCATLRAVAKINCFARIE
jgi:hypothetical protein